MRKGYEKTRVAARRPARFLHHPGKYDDVLDQLIVLEVMRSGVF